MQFVRPLPFDEALDIIGRKSPIGAQLSSAEWSDVPVALRQRAMFSAQVENVRFLQRALDAIGDFLAGNRLTTDDGQSMLKTGGRAAFIQQLREFAQAEGMGPLKPEDAGGLKDITSERRLGLVFDTVTRQAQDYGWWRQGMDPDVLNEFPASRFIRVMDVKEPRQAHTIFENQVYLKTDPIWANRINRDFGTPWGPWGWGCGHDVEEVDRQDAEQLGLVKPGERIEPDTKNFNENLQASARGLIPALLDFLKEAFGDKLAIEDDMLKWKGGQP
jgi:hypothetical protein